jgi:hypothetical protein
MKLGKLGRLNRTQKKTAKSSSKNRWCRKCDSCPVERRGEKCIVCGYWHGKRRSKKIIPDYEFE